ncbi:MAG TPA: hypothetical protein PKH40_00620 [Treponemataceae bacterium]|jgi:hypothetical protein|nr:MAG: hypothetical protein BWY39_00652 [Spirochaetes bacterium ADurb.Bin269]HOC28155.1 hypothetical protein [Treponemataceae bacterium]
MKYTIHTLELHRDIPHPDTAPAPDGTRAVLVYSSAVQKNNLEPAERDHLTGKAETATIRAGHYLFAQGPLQAEFDNFQNPEDTEITLFREAAKEVWLESLWRDIEFLDEKIFVRILSEDGHTVFQIFRAIGQQER